MDYIELKEPGASVAMLVQKIERRKSKFGEDYALIGNVEPNKQASVSVPEKAMERQMEKILKIADVDELKNRFVVISRSDEPGSNGKFYWNVGWADEQAFARTPATSQTGEPKRVPPPANDYGAELKRDPQGIHAGAAQPRAQENPAPAQRELSESQARPAAATPVTERELTDAEKKKRARMSEIRRIWHGLWESELEWQLGIVAKLKAEGRLVDFTVDGSSVNAACASQFIKFDRENLI